MSSKDEQNYATLGGHKDETLEARTGKGWAEWVEVLDGVGAAKMSHPDIARWVNEQIEDGWWAQAVTVGYERIRGLRKVGQARSGSFEASKSKTIRAGAARVYEAISTLAEDAEWLGGLTMSGATEPKSVRFEGADGSRASIWISASGDAKASVSVSHTKLESKEAVDQSKTEWSARLDALAALLKDTPAT